MWDCQRPFYNPGETLKMERKVGRFGGKVEYSKWAYGTYRFNSANG